MIDGLSIRQARADDHKRFIAVIPDWWGGRDLRYGLPRLFLEHFAGTSLVAQHRNRMVGFLVGFLSPDHADEAYVHFLGVDPACQGQGVGRRLYEDFFELCRRNQRHLVRAITSPVNRASVAFHQKMGFDLAPGDDEVEGIPFTRDYDRPGAHMVKFVKSLD